MIVDLFRSYSPVTQAFLATLGTWLAITAGAAVVFFTHRVNQKFLDVTLGFAAGVMIAASYWSLLAPAVALSREALTAPWFPAASGFLLGGLILWSIDRFLPHLHLGFPTETAEGVKTRWRRSTLLVLAVTLHHIPEGLAVGVAFGAAASGSPSTSLMSAIALALGMGLQNIPEGMAISLPLRREGMSMGKSFWYGQLSGIVEPVAGVLGAAAVLLVQPMLPYALAFAAGAMFYVVVEELIPESQLHSDTNLPTLGAMMGFAVMMVLEVAF